MDPFLNLLTELRDAFDADDLYESYDILDESYDILDWFESESSEPSLTASWKLTLLFEALEVLLPFDNSGITNPIAVGLLCFFTWSWRGSPTGSC